jgi:hypothetical protein
VARRLAWRLCKRLVPTLAGCRPGVTKRPVPRTLARRLLSKPREGSPRVRPFAPPTDGRGRRTSSSQGHDHPCRTARSERCGRCRRGGIAPSAGQGDAGMPHPGVGRRSAAGQAHPHPSGPPLELKEDGSPLRPEYATRHFMALATRMGLPRIRLHELRHTHAALAQGFGLRPVRVARASGGLGDRSGAPTIARSGSYTTKALPDLDGSASTSRPSWLSKNWRAIASPVPIQLALGLRRPARSRGGAWSNTPGCWRAESTMADIGSARISRTWSADRDLFEQRSYAHWQAVHGDPNDKDDQTSDTGTGPALPPRQPLCSRPDPGPSRGGPCRGRAGRCDACSATM